MLVLKTIAWFVKFFVVGIAMLIAVGAVLRVFNPGPKPLLLLLTPDDVAGEWPFRADAVEISCCIDGHVSILSETGQMHWFDGARHADRFPLVALGRNDAQGNDFEAAHAAAKHLARRRWPDLVR